MKLARVVDKQRKKYNEQMALRLAHSTNVKRFQKVSNTEPQIRYPSTKVNKGEAFTKVPNFDRKLLVNLCPRMNTSE